MDRKLWVVIKREYMERVRSKWFVVGTLMVPALVVLTFLLPAYVTAKSQASSDARNIVILDATGAGIGARVAGAISSEQSRLGAADASGGETDGGAGLQGGEAAPPATAPAPPERVQPATVPGGPVVRVVAPAALAEAESLATRQVMDKTHVGYLVLDQNALAGGVARYAGRNATSLPDLDRVRVAVRQSVTVAQLQAAGANPQMIDLIARSRVQLMTERITDKGRGGSATTGAILGFGIAFILYLAIMLHGQNVLRSVLDEKTTRVAEVVISSVRPHILLGGKVLGVGLVGLTQQVVWISLSAYLINKLTPLVMRMSGNQVAAMGTAGGFLAALTGVGFKTLALLLGFFLIGFIFYAALYAAIGAMVNSEQEAQQAAVPVMILLVGTFLFAQPVMFQPTSTLANTLSWLPFSSPIIMPLRMTVIQPPTSQIVGSLLVGAVSCVLVVWLAARIYRVGMLMYGKRPSLRELARWVRYS